MPRTSSKSKINKKLNKKKRQRMNHQKLSTQTQTKQKASKVRPILDQKSLFKKYNINIGAKGYIPTKHNKSKSVHIEKCSLMNLGGGNELLFNTELHIAEGSIYGLIGENGCGKTTLLNAMYNYEIDGFPNHIRMLLVQQHEEKNKNKNILQCVLESDILRQQIKQTENKLFKLLSLLNKQNEQQICNEMKSNSHYLLCMATNDYKTQEIDEILDIINEQKKELDFDHSKIKATKIMRGLGFSMEWIRHKKICDLSGGWQTRIKLASALFIEPDLMLLDEPTNHLDFPTVLWLQDYLKNYHKTVIIVSHDKSFINAVCNKTILLSKKTLTYYNGNYDIMMKSQHIMKQKNIRKYKDYKKEFKELQKSIAIYVQKWSKVEDKQQKSVITQKRKRFEFIQTQIEKLEPLIKENKTLKFSFHCTHKNKNNNNVKLEQYVVKMQNICFKYPQMDHMLLRNINLTLNTDSRIGMIGANGIGKTTLIKLIMGNLSCVSGLCDINRRAHIALFTQQHTEQLELKQSAIDYIYDKFKDSDEQMKQAKNKQAYIRSKLGRFKLTGKQHTTIMDNLSGGEKSRVAFCIACWKEPHFIIMDEPTNHLDIQSIDALIDAIKLFNGGCLIISHDQHFLSQIGEEFWSVTSNGIKSFDKFEDAKKFALNPRMLKLDQNKNINKNNTKRKPKIRN